MKDKDDFRTDYSPQEIYGEGFVTLGKEEKKYRKKYRMNRRKKFQ